MRVTLVFSPSPGQLWERTLDLPEGSTVAQALSAGGWDGYLRLVQPTQAGHKPGIGIWGRHAALAETLREGDRLELYRPLKVDPKVARRERFSKQGTRSAGLFAQRRPGAKSGY